jgi:hypothetical protein
MTRALGDGMSNLERREVWKRDILFGSLGNVMTESEEVDLQITCRVTDATNVCLQNSSEQPASKTIQITDSQN